MIINPKSAKAVERQHRDELRNLSESDALLAADRLLAMAADTTWPPEREHSSGLIERQRILYRIGTRK